MVILRYALEHVAATVRTVPAVVAVIAAAGAAAGGAAALIEKQSCESGLWTRVSRAHRHGHRGRREGRKDGKVVAVLDAAAMKDLLLVVAGPPFCPDVASRVGAYC